jgi:saposin
VSHSSFVILPSTRSYVMKFFAIIAVLCLCTVVIAHKNHPLKSERKPLPRPLDQKCTICEFIVNYAEDFLEQNATEQQILHFLEGVCLLFPSQLRPQCRAFVDQEGRDLIQLLIQKFPPNVVCAQLGFCPHRLVKPIRSQAGQYCTICEFIVQAIDGYLENNKTIAQIKQLLDSFCSLLPPNFGNQCVDFIDNYLELAIQWIISTENPDVFCTQIGMCTNKMQTPPKIRPLSAPKLKVNIH